LSFDLSCSAQIAAKPAYQTASRFAWLGETICSAVLKLQIWTQIDDPDASGDTVVTGINNHHRVVGYYNDSSGNFSGFLANPN
jgi:hypothetical protein